MNEELELLDLLGLSYDLRGNQAKMVCPLPDHADTSPSCSVWPREGRFYCFGCEAQGDLLELYAKVRGLDRLEAETEIARLTGKPPPRQRGGDRIVEREARGKLEGRLRNLRPDVSFVEHAALGDRVDKICWAYRKGLIDETQLRGAVTKFFAKAYVAAVVS